MNRIYSFAFNHYWIDDYINIIIESDYGQQYLQTAESYEHPALLITGISRSHETHSPVIYEGQNTGTVHNFLKTDYYWFELNGTKHTLCTSEGTWGRYYAGDRSTTGVSKNPYTDTNYTIKRCVNNVPLINSSYIVPNYTSIYGNASHIFIPLYIED